MKWELVGVIVSANACGDLLNTLGMRHHGKVRAFAPGSLTREIAGALRSWYIIGGIAAMAVAFAATVVLLSVAPVSFAVPATAASFVLETALAKIVLKEEVHWQRWLGAALVACGVALLAIS